MRKNVTINLSYNYGEENDFAFPDAPELGKTPHAQLAMRHMGITYKEAEPSSLTDSWTFYDCDSIPNEPHPKWMGVFEGGKTLQEFYQESMERVRSTPEPEGQKFPVGSRVMISADLGPYMSHFPSGKSATVAHTYAHAYGGTNVKSYSLDVDGYGNCSWFYEEQLTLL